jgi:hypothetical protein
MATPDRAKYHIKIDYIETLQHVYMFTCLHVYMFTCFNYKQLTQQQAYM